LLLFSLLTGLQLGACGTGHSESSPMHGQWTVIGWWTPGISALSQEQAESWVGTRAAYGEALAEFGPKRCRNPDYHQESLTREDFIEHYRVRPETLGVDRTPIPVVHVDCGLAPSPGQVLILKSPHRMITLWDGAFLEMAREMANPLAD